MTPEEEKIIIESLKILEGQKRKLLSLIKKPDINYNLMPKNVSKEFMEDLRIASQKQAEKIYK